MSWIDKFIFKNEYGITVCPICNQFITTYDDNFEHRHSHHSFEYKNGCAEPNCKCDRMISFWFLNIKYIVIICDNKTVLIPYDLRGKSFLIKKQLDFDLKNPKSIIDKISKLTLLL